MLMCFYAPPENAKPDQVGRVCCMTGAARQGIATRASNGPLPGSEAAG